MNGYIDVIKDNYNNFNGRARRKEFWIFLLWHFLVTIVVLGFELVIDTDGLLFGLYGLFIILPLLGVTVRRLHDRGIPDWGMLVLAFTVVGGIILVILLAMDSQPYENKYGPCPK